MHMPFRLYALYRPDTVRLMKRAILLIAALLFCGHAWSNVPEKPIEQTKTAQQNTNSENKGTEQNPLFVKVEAATKSKAETDEEQSDKLEHATNESLTAKGTIALAIITGILAIATIVLAGFTWKLWSATTKLVNGAEKIAEKQLRAYVHGTVGRCGWRLSEDKSRLVSFEINIKFENAGVTPALDCNAMSAAAVNVAPPFKKPPGENDVLITIPPGGNMPAKPIVLSIQELTGVFEKSTRVFIWGLVEYRDVFSKKDITPRHTEICLEVSVESDPNDSRLITSFKNSVIPDIVSFRFVNENNSNS